MWSIQMKLLKAILLSVVAFGVTPVAASAGNRLGVYMLTGDDVAAPSGFADMCRRDPDSCMPSGLVRTSGSSVRLDAVNDAALQRVNRDVNDAITPAEDKKVYGVAEMWIDPLAGLGPTAKARGDCEDYALAKRDRLLALGWPPEALFLAVGYHPQFGLHAVLIARTDRGDMVLDSRTPWINVWTDTPYIWVKRQLAANSAAWVRPYEPRRYTIRMASSATAADATSALPPKGW
jgi:predicted transglutaminase-like cysteine proteinase